LVCLLTDPEVPDPRLVDVVLLTYRTLLTPLEFFRLLAHRFYCPTSFQELTELAAFCSQSTPHIGEQKKRRSKRSKRSNRKRRSTRASTSTKKPRQTSKKSTEILAEFEQRYYDPTYQANTPPKNKKPMLFASKRQQTSTRLRTLNTLKIWIQTYPEDFVESKSLMELLLAFVYINLEKESTLQTVVGSIRSTLSKYIDCFQFRLRIEAKDHRKIQFSSKPPKPLFLKSHRIRHGFRSMTISNMAKSISAGDASSNTDEEQSTLRINSILKIHPVEAARQLSIAEQKAFRRIQLREFISWLIARDEETKIENSPNLYNMVERFNMITLWFAYQVLKEKQIKMRTKVLTHIICIAYTCLNLGNFSTMMQISAACQLSSMCRLKRTWAGLETRIWEFWETVLATSKSDNGWKMLRKSLLEAADPRIPYMGLFLTDLTFINYGNTDFIESTSIDTSSPRLINFWKRRLFARSILKVKELQQSVYCLQKVKQIQNFLKQATNPSLALSEAFLREQSLKIEPKMLSTTIK